MRLSRSEGSRSHRREPGWSLTWILVLGLSVAACAGPGRPPAPGDWGGHWEGALTLPGGSMQMQVDLVKGDAGWEGTIAIPAARVEQSLQAVRVDGSRVRLAFPDGGAIEGTLEGGLIKGQILGQGQMYPLTLKRTARVARRTVATLPEGMIPREALFTSGERLNPKLSPDGTRLAYMAAANVWVRSLGKDDDRVVTSETKPGISNFFWQLDGEHLLYSKDRDGGESWHLYQTNLATRLTRDLTPFEGVKARRIHWNDRRPGQLLVEINIRDRRWHDVYRLDLKNGALDLDTENPGDVTDWTVDWDLQVRAALAWSAAGLATVRVRDAPGSSWRDLQRWEAGDFGSVESFTSDGRGLLLVSDVGASTARLLEVELATGRTTVVAEDPAYDVTGWMADDLTGNLVAVKVVRARSEWTALDPSMEPHFEVLRTLRDGACGVASGDRNDITWLVRCDEDDRPPSYYTYRPATRQATWLFSQAPSLEKYTLAKMQPISFSARDGMTLHGYLTLPRDRQPRNLPMVLKVHGGPWQRDVWGLDAEAQWLANRGYAVLQVNFRGSTGYGKAYRNAGDHEWGGKMHTDLVDGKRWAVRQGYADPGRVCVMGASYGGYATLVALAFTPDQFACGIALAGPSNLVSWLKSAPPHWTPERWAARRVGNVDTEEEFLKSRSPLFKADEIKVPLLIAHGAKDPRVKQTESDQLVAAIRKNGRPVEYIVFPDEGHGLGDWQNRLGFYAAAEQFLGRHLGGRVEPASAKEEWALLRR